MASIFDNVKDSQDKKQLDEAKRIIGKIILSEEQVLLLACESISHTFTHEEKKYYQ